MAAQTLRIYERRSDNAYVDLIYDDVALTCGGANVHVPSGAKPLTVTLVVGDNPITETFQAGTDQAITLPTTLSVLTGQGRDGTGVAIVGFDSISFGNG